MTIRDSLKKYPAIEADLLLAHILKKSKEFLYVHPEKVLTAPQVQKFGMMVRQRLRGIPVAYLLGYKNFYGLRFDVSPDVLIPRPESEWLVDRTLEEIKKRPGPLRILDMGTGSGCLAISIAKFATGKNIRYTAVDISKKALSIAKMNAVKHHVKIKFIHSNLFKNTPDAFDLIIANLPYVPHRDYKKLYTNLKYEPRLALTDPEADGAIYQKFLRRAENHLKTNALILFEIDPGYRLRILKSLKKYLPNHKISFHRDLGKRWRYAAIDLLDKD